MKGRSHRTIDLVDDEVPLWQRRDPPWVHAVLGLAMIAFLSWADNVIGPRVSLDYFYLVPVILAAWRGNRDVSLFLVFAGGLAWFACEWPFGAEELKNAVPSSALRPDPLFRVWEATMLTGFLAVVCLLICRLREMFERERSHARTDELTGLANRRTFCERLDHEIERMRRTQRPFTLAAIDLDNFKYMNDHFGHQTGDEVLRVISQHLLDQLRVTDLPGRMGGDEFALLLTETDATGARTCLMELLNELTDAMKERGWPVGCSIGAVTFRVSVDSVNAALHLADEQMYAAKRAGKGRLEQLVYFGPGNKPAEAEAGGASAQPAPQPAPQPSNASRGKTILKPSSRRTLLPNAPAELPGETTTKARAATVVIVPKESKAQTSKSKRNPAGEA